MAKQREATPDEFKAMAHPLRLRILRLCLHDSLTNKEIADRLGKDPATVLHHVRVLVEHGFLRAERPRTGARGALEKPYRATGKSWNLSVERFPADQQLVQALVMVDALRGEMIEAGAERTRHGARLGLRLGDEAAAELATRLEALVQEYAARPVDPAGKSYGLFTWLHERP